MIQNLKTLALVAIISSPVFSTEDFNQEGNPKAEESFEVFVQRPRSTTEAFSDYSRKITDTSNLINMVRISDPRLSFTAAKMMDSVKPHDFTEFYTKLNLASDLKPFEQYPTSGEGSITLVEWSKLYHLKIAMLNNLYQEMANLSKLMNSEYEQLEKSYKDKYGK